MARPIAEKCRQCSKLSAEDAKQKDCWDQLLCHQRRYNYRKRGSRVKELRERREAAREPKEVEVPDVHTLAPSVVYYRISKESPVHAIAAELRENGKLISWTQPKHCIGATEGDIHNWLREVLAYFSEEYGRSVGKFVRDGTELHPSECPLCRSAKWLGN